MAGSIVVCAMITVACANIHAVENGIATDALKQETWECGTARELGERNHNFACVSVAPDSGCDVRVDPDVLDGTVEAELTIRKGETVFFPFKWGSKLKLRCESPYSGLCKFRWATFSTRLGGGKTPARVADRVVLKCGNGNSVVLKQPHGTLTKWELKIQVSGECGVAFAINTDAGWTGESTIESGKNGSVVIGPSNRVEIRLTCGGSKDTCDYTYSLELAR